MLHYSLSQAQITLVFYILSQMSILFQCMFIHLYQLKHGELFMQMFIASVLCEHAHMEVHGICDLAHLQRRVMHCFLQEQDIISKQLSGIGLLDIKIGLRPPSSRSHVMVIGSGRFGVEM